MKDRNYFQVHAWMVTKLELRGVDRDVFAIIYGFTQDKETLCRCSYKYMVEITGYSKPTILAAVERLESKHLIEKVKSESNTDMRNLYRCNLDLVDEILEEGVKPLDNQGVKPLDRGSKPSLPHNISINKDITKEVQAEPVPTNKNHKHSQIYKERTGLTNVLESEKDIADYNNKQDKR